MEDGHMAYSARDDGRRQRSSRSSSRSRQSSRSRNSNRSSRNTNRGASRSSAPQSRRGTLTQPDTGYKLHSRRVSRQGSRNGSGGILELLLRPRVLLFIAIILVVVVVLFMGISSCVRGGGGSDAQKTEETKPKNEQDSRVAAGVSAAMTSKFTIQLDQNNLLEKIAKNADEYDDDRLLTLALNEPESREFVAAYPSSDKSSRPYEDEVSRGEVPRLYDWDARWGAVTYGDGPLAITGSGPTTLAMAYMGLTGKTDFSPTEIAQRASKSNYAEGDSGSKGTLFSKLGASMGLESEQYDPAAETLLYTLNDSTVVAVELKAQTLTDDAHWALVVNINLDGSVTVFDPTSTLVSSRPWSMGTIASSSNTFYALRASQSTLDEVSDTEDGDSTDTTDTTSTDTTTTDSAA